MKKHILIVEDDPIMRLGMSHFLTSQGHEVSLCTRGSEGLSTVRHGSFDLIITDLKLPGKGGLDILKKTKEVAPKTGVIIITGYAEVKGAVQAIKEGAFDYIAKPFSNEELLIAIERFFQFQKLEDEVIYLRETLKGRGSCEDLIGNSHAIKDVIDRIESVASTDIPVLIQGESGTGKELVANAIHRLSRRSRKPFIKINCAAIPENLFESELFGHEKGAFTGATDVRKGKFEFADDGTIFFDEIGDIPLSLQSKLLRVLEDNIITRLGGNTSIRVEVRSIYATSKNLKECVAAGSFRDDLFYRINVVPITISPLRERKEDIQPLIAHFIQCFKEKFNKEGLALSQFAYDTLLNYNYPGNVRELKHAIERAVVLSKDGLIELKHLPDEISGAVNGISCIKDNLSLEASVRCLERQKIIKALNDAGGKKMEAAKTLGISRKVLWRKLKEYGIN
ncbi:MAG: sigma-54 dependent transcriptional regulator [Nitrospirae bacterium]|nr:sigma-54 dependent transcriptional regulator [Nitrospirota bacterium]MCL5237456.1 sigma-54 dependent transcriptional regulator [Nitrospirota bacterium]